MFRTAPALRATLTAVVVLGATVALAACGGAAPVTEETPKPTTTGFATIGDGESPVPLDTSAPVEPTDPAATGYTQVFDDLGIVTVAVPDGWIDIDGEGFTTDTQQEWAYLAASEDLAGYNQNWNTSGVEVGATSAAGVTLATLENLLASISGGYAECGTIVEDDVAYDDGVFTGVTSTWSACGGGATTGFAIAATNSSDASQMIFVRGQINGDNYDVNEVLTAIVQSFDTSIGRGPRGK